MLKFDKHFGLQIIKPNLPCKVFNRDDLRNARECKKKKTNIKLPIMITDHLR